MREAMQLRRIIRILKRLTDAYSRFVEREGFFLVLLCCAGVIIGTAMWTNANAPAPLTPPAIPTDAALLAAELLQQSLAEAAQATETPESKPAADFTPPVASAIVLAHFSGGRLTQSPITGVWKVHDAVDLAVAAGEIISAIADGIVLETGEKTTRGAYLIIEHPDGIVAEYAGMAALAGIRKGDPVSCGQTIGFGGAGMIDEADEPHLHLRVMRDGIAIDPLILWK